MMITSSTPKPLLAPALAAALLLASCASGGLTPAPEGNNTAENNAATNNTGVNNSSINNNNTDCPRTACTIGQSICTASDQVQTCQDDGTGCGAYGLAETCSDARVCIDGRCTTGCVDEDGDGHGNGCSNGPDCDDTDPDKHPDKVERCDNKDNNCDAQIDEGDACAPGCADEECTPGSFECVDDERLRECQSDQNGCGSWGPAVSCGGACAGDACATCTDNDGDQRGPGCPFGEDCDDNDAQVYPNAAERCDDKDNDCDDDTDEDNVCATDCTNQPCTPGQRQCADAASIRECRANAFGCGEWANPVSCGGSCTIDRCDNCVDNDGDQRGSNCALGADCDDGDPDAYEGAEELCDDLDNDCDDDTDEGFDVGGACSAGIGACARNGTTVCSAAGFGTICNALPGSGGTERCGDGIDNDCDGQTDEGFAQLGQSCSDGVGACLDTGTFVCDGDSLSCNAQAGSPSAEVCDSADNNCNGQTDEGDVCGAPSFTCPADDDLEPNDSSSAATNLPRSTSQDAIMCGTGSTSDKDWFNLGNYSSGQAINVRIEFNTSGCRMHLEIYSGTTFIIASDPNTASHTLTYTPTTTRPDPYKVWVYPNANVTAGCPYTITHL